MRIRTVLSLRPLQFIGRTSYSFYLLHLVILFAFAPLVYRGVSSFVLTWAVCLFLSYVAAHLSYEYVERPGIRLGHRLAAKFS